MNSVDHLWQDFIEREKLRLMNLPVEELLALDFFTAQFVDSPQEITDYGLWHETPEWRNSEVHSFILQASRKLFPNILGFGFYRNYLSGFSIDKTGAIIPISEDVLLSYD